MLDVIHKSNVLYVSEDRKLLERSVSCAEEDTTMVELEGLEKTFPKRRTELREVERLLSEAEADLRDTRAKVCLNLTA